MPENLAQGLGFLLGVWLAFEAGLAVIGV